jgi:hypothetical protein
MLITQKKRKEKIELWGSQELINMSDQNNFCSEPL